METTEPKTEGKKYKLLLVEDDKFLLDMYATKFGEGSRFETTAVPSAADGLAKLEEGMEPDIILTDIIMPGMDGFEFLQAIKEKNLAKSTVKIVLSNLGQKEDIDKGMALGAKGYIVKATATPTETMKKVLEIVEQTK